MESLEKSPATTAPALDTIQRLVLGGDLSKMDNAARVTYYVQLCESLKLNPYTQPFQILRLSGKEVLYATKSCTEQLRKQNKVSVVKLEHRTENGLMVVTCSVKNSTGRTDASTGAVVIDGLKGEALANAYMKCETKAKRRATLSICGLGMLDESELDTIKGIEQVPLPSLTEAGTSAEVVAPAEAPAPMKAVPAEPVPAETPAAPAIAYATAAQKEEIIRLLNHPVITRPEKTKMLLNINRLDEERAAKAIAKLLGAIQDREGSTEYVVVGSAEMVAPPVVEPAPVNSDLLTDATRAALESLMKHPLMEPKERAGLSLPLGQGAIREPHGAKLVADWTKWLAARAKGPTKALAAATEAEQADAWQELADYLDQQADAMPKADWRRLSDALEVEANATTAELRAALAEAQQIMAALPGKPVAGPAAPASPAPVAPVGSGPSSTPAPSQEDEDPLDKPVVIALLRDAETLADLRDVWEGEAKRWRLDVDVLAAKEARKTELTQDLHATV